MADCGVSHGLRAIDLAEFRPRHEFSLEHSACWSPPTVPSQH
jgi:hypothetical protein